MPKAKKKIKTSKIKDSFNIVLMGDSQVGKTSLLERYCLNFFRTEPHEQKSVVVFKKILEINKDKYRIKFWDTPCFIDNCDNFKKDMFENSDAIIFVCSYDIKESLVHINTWYQYVMDFINIIEKEMILLINKKDLENDKSLNEEQIIKKSKDLQLDYYEVSAKTGDNINNAIIKISQKIINRIKENVSDDEDSDKKNKEQDGCLLF